MDRRTLLASATTAAAALLATTKSFAADAKPSGKTDAILDAAEQCVKNGNICIQHCIDLMSKGDKSMAGCLVTSRDMVAFSQLVIQLATAKSPQLPEFLKLSAKVAEDCGKACSEHASHHAICKTCEDCCKTASKAYRA